MEDEYQPLYRLRLLLQREIWHRISNDHMFDRDDVNTETVVEALIDVQRAIGDLPHELSMALRKRRGIYRLNLREDRAAQEKGAIVNRPHAVRARKTAPKPSDRSEGCTMPGMLNTLIYLLMIGMELTSQTLREVNHRSRVQRT